MKLSTPCPSCKNEYKISTWFIENRLDLAHKLGKEFTVTCKKCGLPFKAHVDNVKAYNDLRVPIIGGFSLIVAIGLTILLWDFGFISTATIAIPIIMATTTRNNQRTKIQLFNQLYYDSKRLRSKL